MHVPRKYRRGGLGGGVWGGGGVQAHPLQVFPVTNLIYGSFLKKTIIFQDSREGSTFSGGGGGGVKLYRGGGGGGGGQSIRIQITCDFPGGGFGPPFPSGSSHENSLFRCFAHGLKMCMSCALDIIVKLFSLSLFYELVIQLQVDICILDTILMLPEFGPESGALATVGEFVL